MEIPKLTPRDIHQLLRETFPPGRTHDRHLLAVFGRGDPDTLDVGSAGSFRVEPVSSELQLRRVLPPLHDPEQRMVFLVGWGDAELPPDIAGRFAKRGRILRVGRDARLHRMFGGAEVEAEVVRSPLGRFLAAQDDLTELPVAGGRVGLHVAWNAWLSRAWSIDVSGGLALDRLMAWAARNGQGASFTSLVARPETTLLRAALLEHLGRPDVLGPAGPMVWRAWETGRGEELLQFAVLLEALWQGGRAVDPTVEVWLSTVCQSALGFDPTRDPEAVEGLRSAAAGALRLLRDGAPDRMRALLRDAEARVTHEAVRTHLVESRLLPVAWDLRLQRLGRHLAEVAVQPTAEHVQMAKDLLAALDRHDQFMANTRTRDYERAQMACRLLAFLAVRTDQRVTVTPAPESQAEAYGRWYAEQGGYVDWARQWARGATPNTDFGRGAAAVLAEVDKVRTELDRAFARALPAWLEVKPSARHLLPIEQAVARTVVPYLRGDGGNESGEPRRLLVLLMDGMAWAQAVELLASLGESHQPWSPIAFNDQVMERPITHLPVVALTPSITEVSRVAFFGGQVPAAGKDHRTTDDPRRWRDHPALRPFFPGADAPQLLLKGDGFGRDGSAAPEALTLVRDPSQPVVAIVINAIDDHLKAGSQEDRDWTIGRISALRDLLDAAQESGRAVLLASDHGHVPGDRMTDYVGKVDGGGARWRPWMGPGDPVADFECAVPSPHGWAPKGARGVVGLVDDTRTYRPQQHAGEHGGVSLAELLAPAVFIGWEGMNHRMAAHQDPAHELRNESAPAWWAFDVLLPQEAAPAPRKTRKPKRDDKDQLSLIAPSTAGVALPKVLDDLERLRKSELLRDLAGTSARLDEVLQAVQALLERGGVASRDAFASAMGQRPFRVPGLVSTLSLVLNVDGTPVLRYDPTAEQVLLNKAQLRQLFDE